MTTPRNLSLKMSLAVAGLLLAATPVYAGSGADSDFTGQSKLGPNEPVIQQVEYVQYATPTYVDVQPGFVPTAPGYYHVMTSNADGTTTTTTTRIISRTGGEPASASDQALVSYRIVDTGYPIQNEGYYRVIESGPVTATTTSAAPYIPPSSLPQIQRAGNIAYLTGGVGLDERQAMEAAQKDFNLRVLSANKAGEFTGNMRLKLLDASGKEVVNAEAGPLFYAQLPQGKYTLVASDYGWEKKQDFLIGPNRATNVYMHWQ